ncbi:hypothetical protein INT45_002473 [Circinella minor]|uniref:Rieske domain-containing protein n=1 Tax=Circinella minor TaxID=1195481 RepID=A0A8H7SB01_9FUNG|nr:hypothetical protein INT45_002473 [Circinella minor]
MFVPTIKIKRVNETQEAITHSIAQLQINNDSKSKTPSAAHSSHMISEKSNKTPSSPSTTATKITTVQNEPSVTKKEIQPKEEPVSKETPQEDTKLTNTTTEPSITTVSVDEYKNKEPTIEVDPSDKESIIVTLTNGKKFTADRYCPHAGADLTYLGEVAEDEYPPEIGPILMCTLHYWEFLLEKEGRSANGWATLNACPVPEDQCPVGENNKKLDW